MSNKFDNVEELLSNSLKNLEQLYKVIKEVIEHYPYQKDIDMSFDSGASGAETTIRKYYEDFYKTFDEARKRLQKPNLSIAMIGVTSSGKSTIVNSLIGRKIAPMESGEASAGTLTLKHSNESELVIEETKNAKWETGRKTELNDDQLYDQIRNKIMLPFHEHRKKEEIEAPRVSVSVPLLPVCDFNLLELPPEVDVEFIDLPGLQSVTDTDNLKFIQDRVKKSFNIVVLNYQFVGDEHREELLNNLKTNIEFQQGRTDSIIFILNKINLRTGEDFKLDDKLKQLKENVKSKLGLKELPEIIPFNSLLIYYAQCAWGSSSLCETSSIVPEIRLELLSKMFNDDNCWGKLSKREPKEDDFLIKKDWCSWSDNFNNLVNKESSLSDLPSFEDKWHKWLRNVQKSVLDNKQYKQHIDDEKMRVILQYVLNVTHGKKLWDTLRNRVQEYFPEIVLSPALQECLINCQKLLEFMNKAIKIKRLNKKEEIETKQKRIKTFDENLRDSIKKSTEEYKTKVEKLQGSPQELSSVIHSFKEDDITGFQHILDIFEDVQADLTTKIISPIRNAFEDQDFDNLKKNLNEINIPTNIVDDIVTKFESVNQIFQELLSPKDNTYKQGFIPKQCKTENKDEIKTIEEAEEEFRYLYLYLRQGLSKRAEFVFQGKVADFENAINSLIKDQRSKIESQIEQVDPSLYKEYATLINASLEKKQYDNNPVKLDDDLFKIELNIEVKTTQKEEVIGQRTVKERKCLVFTDKKREDIKGGVSYTNFTFPTSSKITNELTEGIKSGQKQITEKAKEFIYRSLNQSASNFETSTTEIVDYIAKLLASQLKNIEDDFTIKKRSWKKLKLN